MNVVHLNFTSEKNASSLRLLSCLCNVDKNSCYYVLYQIRVSKIFAKRHPIIVGGSSARLICEVLLLKKIYKTTHNNFYIQIKT